MNGSTLTIALDILGLTSVIAGAILTVLSRVTRQTISGQKDLIETYEKRLQALEAQREVDRTLHLDNVKAIADMQGQIKVYKELPLQEMATAMQEISRVNKTIAESNEKILYTLKSSAVIAATDREDSILNPPTIQQTVQEQTVQHQTVETQA